MRGHPLQTMLETAWKYIPVYGDLNLPEKAREWWGTCRSIDPTFSTAQVKDILHLWNFPELFIERYLAGFAKAGFPLEK